MRLANVPGGRTASGTRPTSRKPNVVCIPSTHKEAGMVVGSSWNNTGGPRDARHPLVLDLSASGNNKLRNLSSCTFS